mmetsp:Transcript_10173/g.12552  ORF Transcript_10173/g.12552 Transcript_10173/m.12552 type:complete len:373 (+) Transcript_10173:136-1254(+)|eukprot:CAMPEP_0197293122 /NCGR_PEP_ID=MMETSP0890-20130614/26915_1 /TAXON_ID=44058 ORGANISM="Aureoumbra lagunensis, Strain CCMP1510" /NCGR_SAMPLE_ID=MMETSP0890 /ASSEMBLY_ACC=CAM_ASM_000533 /LENGTH=372 /DNA_ID=CAMNT_0042767599 /DNA_START=59 /DNA_END=1177 /DNA_ORIENTATION=+
MRRGYSFKKRRQVSVRENCEDMNNVGVSIEKIREEIRIVLKEELQSLDKRQKEEGQRLKDTLISALPQRQKQDEDKSQASSVIRNENRYIVELRIALILMVVTCVCSSISAAWLTSRWQLLNIPKPDPSPVIFDEDGDGIADADDFCTGSTFISGKATDWDADGCEDSVEDNDKDGDGISDEFDKCPKSARSDFASNINNDLDQDGCEDSVEDNDDDGDGIDNIHDSCARTEKGSITDAFGCSFSQRQQQHSKRQKKIAWRVSLISVEALFGAFFAALIGHLWPTIKKLRSFIFFFGNHQHSDQGGIIQEKEPSSHACSLKQEHHQHSTNNEQPTSKSKKSPPSQPSVLTTTSTPTRSSDPRLLSAEDTETE